MSGSLLVKGHEYSPLFLGTNIIVYNKGLWVVLNVKKGDLNDPLGKTEDISEKGHWGNGDYRIWLENDDDFEYTIGLIKQAYAYQDKA